MTAQDVHAIPDVEERSAPTRPDPSLDWRFLLPSAELGAVAVGGSATSADASNRSRAALAACATSVMDLRDAESGTVDTVVLGNPSRRQLQLAVRALRPFGTIVVEAAPARRRRRGAADLAAHGFEVSSWWARPSTQDTWCLVGLDDPRAAATVIRTVAGRGRRTGAEARWARAGLAGRWGRQVTVLARHGASARTEHAVAAAGPGHRVAALVTPRYAASRAVVGVGVDASGRSLERIVKLARSPLDDEAVLAEGRALDAYAAAGGSGAPGGHRTTSHGGRWVLVEDAAAGTPLDRRAVRRDLDDAQARGMAWLGSVPVGAPSPVRTDGRSDALLRRPLAAVAKLPASDVVTHREWVRRAARTLRPLATATTPVVFEHGDLGHPNLFTGTAAPLVAIDWERATPAGLPCQDLLFFVAYLAESLDRPGDDAELAASYRRALRAGGWARADLDLLVERQEVDPRLLPALEVACWTRALARLAEDGGRPPDGHRFHVLWHEAIDHAEERRR